MHHGTPYAAPQHRRFHPVLGAFVLSLLTEAAHAQTGAEVAFFYWIFLGGSALVLLGLLAWFVYILIRSRTSEENKRFRNARSDREGLGD
jgi:hypothetical protein